MHINQPVSLVPPHFSPGPVSLIYCFCFRVVLLICSHEFAHFQLHLQNILFKFKKIINLKQSKSHCNFKISYRERDNVYLFLHLCYRQQVQNYLHKLTWNFGTYRRRKNHFQKRQETVLIIMEITIYLAILEHALSIRCYSSAYSYTK